MAEPKLLTVAQVAERLGKTEKAVRRMLDRKTLANGGVVSHGRRMIPASALPMTEGEEVERLSDEIGIPVEQLNQWLGDREELGVVRGMRQIEEKARGEVAELNQEIRQQQTRASGLEQERDAALGERDRLRGDLDAARQELDRVMSQVEDLMRSVEQERGRAVESAARIETLRTEFAAVSAEREGQIETLRAQVAALGVESDEQTATLRTEIETLRADLAVATQRATLAESHLPKRRRRRLDLTPETEG